MNSVFFNEMTDDQVLSPETAEKLKIGYLNTAFKNLKTQ
jgi:hypothetical protein